MPLLVGRCSLFAVVGLCCLIGCGPSDPLGRKPISGVVSMNGTPVVAGTISFEPQGGGASTSSGANISNGKFAIEKEFGLPPGKYLVRVSIPKPGTGGVFKEGTLPGDMLAPPEEMAPADWNANSKQTIEVNASGPFEFTFDVKTKTN